MSRFLIVTGLERDLPHEELIYEAEQALSPNEVANAEIVLGVNDNLEIRVIKHPRLRAGQLAGRAVSIT